MITESSSDRIMMYGFLFPAFVPVSDPPMTTGSSGSRHGARTVRNPATNEARRSDSICH